MEGQALLHDPARQNELGQLKPLFFVKASSPFANRSCARSIALCDLPIFPAACHSSISSFVNLKKNEIFFLNDQNQIHKIYIHN
jgi:hypothetical protein